MQDRSGVYPMGGGAGERVSCLQTFLSVKKEIRILTLEDNVADAELIRFALREGGLQFSLKRVESKTAFLKELEEHTPDVILLDYALPGFDGFSALTLAQDK